MTETDTGTHEIHLDASKCRAYGLCVGLAPDNFDLPSGTPRVTVTRPIVGAEDYEDVEEAVESCPAEALRLIRREES